jgi:hypothetical protein
MLPIFQPAPLRAVALVGARVSKFSAYVMSAEALGIGSNAISMIAMANERIFMKLLLT